MYCLTATSVLGSGNSPALTGSCWGKQHPLLNGRYWGPVKRLRTDSARCGPRRTRRPSFWGNEKLAFR
jgi:hypothetical protein